MHESCASNTFISPLSAFEGVTPLGQEERYSPDTLYEKINGRAPTYPAFNFQELRSRSFSIPGAAGHSVGAYLYRMPPSTECLWYFFIGERAIRHRDLLRSGRIPGRHGFLFPAGEPLFCVKRQFVLHRRGSGGYCPEA